MAKLPDIYFYNNSIFLHYQNNFYFRVEIGMKFILLLFPVIFSSLTKFVKQYHPLQYDINEVESAHKLIRGEFDRRRKRRSHDKGPTVDIKLGFPRNLTTWWRHLFSWNSWKP